MRLKDTMKNKFTHLKTSKHEIIELWCAQATLKSAQNKKLFYHTNLHKLHKSDSFSKQDKCFQLWVAHISVQSSMKNNHSCDCLLFQICWDKTHTEESNHKLVEHASSDQHNNKYSISS